MRECNEPHFYTECIMVHCTLYMHVYNYEDKQQVKTTHPNTADILMRMRTNNYSVYDLSGSSFMRLE